MIRLEELRKKRGLSQESMAKVLNITQQAYSHYERGKRAPDYETLKKIAEYFETSTSYIIGESDDPSPPNMKKENTPSEKPIEEQTDEEIFKELRFAFYDGMKKPLTPKQKKEIVEMVKLMTKLKREQDNEE